MAIDQGKIPKCTPLWQKTMLGMDTGWKNKFV
jgi:hypothetical protein